MRMTARQTNKFGGFLQMFFDGCVMGRAGERRRGREEGGRQGGTTWEGRLGVLTEERDGLESVRPQVVF